jgi:hypothetical protein
VWLVHTTPAVRTVVRYGCSILWLFTGLQVHLQLRGGGGASYALGVAVVVAMAALGVWVAGALWAYYQCCFPCGRRQRGAAHVAPAPGETGGTATATTTTATATDRWLRSWWQVPIRLDDRWLHVANTTQRVSDEVHEVVPSRTMFTFAHDERLMLLQATALQFDRPLEDVLQMDLTSRKHLLGGDVAPPGTAPGQWQLQLQQQQQSFAPAFARSRSSIAASASHDDGGGGGSGSGGRGGALYPQQSSMSIDDGAGAGDPFALSESDASSSVGPLDPGGSIFDDGYGGGGGVYYPPPQRFHDSFFEA